MDEDPDYIEPREFKRKLAEGEPADVRGGKRPRMIKNGLTPPKGVSIKAGVGVRFENVRIYKGVEVKPAPGTTTIRR